MMNSHPQVLPNDSIVSFKNEEAIKLLPAISTMQHHFASEDKQHFDSTQALGIPAHPLKILNSVIEHFPAQDIYKIGKELGMREFRAFYLAFISENPLLLEKNWRSILEQWWAYAYLSEYGDVNLDLSEEHNDFFFVTFTNTKVYKTKGSQQKPVCPLIAGVLAGFFSSLSGFDFETIETECHEKGHKNCTFLLGNSGLVNSEKFWQEIHEIY